MFSTVSARKVKTFSSNSFRAARLSTLAIFMVENIKGRNAWDAFRPPDLLHHAVWMVVLLFFHHEPEDRPLTRCALHAKAEAMALQDRLGDGQPQAGAGLARILAAAVIPVEQIGGERPGESCCSVPFIGLKDLHSVS